MLAKKIKKRDLNAVFCFYILLILVTIIKKKIQCCTFKFNLKSKQNIKHYYSTVSLKFCFMMTNWLHLWKVWTQESSFGGDYFANWLHVSTTKMCFVSLTICDRIFSMLFTTNWTPSIIMLILLILFYYCQSKITHLHVTGLYSFPL